MIQPLLEQMGWHGFAEEVALQHVAAFRAQEDELLVRLDPLGHHLQPQAVSEPDDAARDGEKDCLGMLSSRHPDITITELVAEKGLVALSRQRKIALVDDTSAA